MGGRRAEELGSRDGARPTGDTPLRAIIERLADGIVIVDREGIVRFANPAAEALFGRPESELLGNVFGHLAVAGETTEIDVVRRGGGTATAELRVVDVEWEGEPAQLVSLRDVTDRKLALDQARRLAHEQAARAEAEAASHAKSEFLAMMSHELRTPLNAVVGYVDLLELGLAGPLTEQQRQQLGRIRASGRHLLGLVNEVLDLAKVEAGRLAVRREAAEAADTAATAAALILPQVGERGLTLVEQRESAEGTTYLGDEDRVRQVLLNLLSNAVKFTPAGGRVMLTHGLSKEPDKGARLSGAREWVVFRVIDTGIGIPPQKLGAIFDPFVQVESGHTRPRDGSGLGLTISRRLARLMGGDLTVRSTPGSGSTFSLWLPSASGEPARAPTPASTLRISAPPRLRGLADVGESLLRETEPLVDAIVARLRADPAIPDLSKFKFSHVADHTGTLIADVAESLVVLEESAGQPSPMMADATLIQRLIAERHGVQRARLGWPAEALRREYAILREEVERSIRRVLPTGAAPAQEIVDVVSRFFEQAEYVSLSAHASAGAGTD